MTSTPTLTAKGTEVLDAAMVEYDSPHNRLAELPSSVDARNVLRAVILKFATEQYGYDDYDTDGALELLASDVESVGGSIDVDKIREVNDGYEMDTDLLSGEMSLDAITDRWEYARDSAVVLRFYQAARCGFEDVLDADPGSSTWDPKEVYPQVFNS